MINLNAKLRERQENGEIINVGIIGAGQMGKGLVSQLSRLNGMRPAAVFSRDIRHVYEAFDIAGVPRDMLMYASSSEKAGEALKAGKYAAADDFSVVCRAEAVDVVIDATGNTDAGARIASEAIKNGKHIVMLNVETDVTIGHILKRMADEAGVIYTASSGDEPGAVKELYDFADAVGLEVLVMGKGKNNKVDLECNPDTVMQEALSRGIAPKMLASFKDGTKTMVELTCMSNSTGFLPDVRGSHGAKVTTDNVCDILNLKQNGGILNGFKVVEYVDGMSPGVFVIVTTDMPQLHHEIQYLKVGKGTNYLLYRPYHLCSIETPVTVARAVIYNEPSLVQLAGAPKSETITIAKKDLKKGELIDGIGGYCVYGTIETYEKAKESGFVPVGLINENTRVLCDVKKGTPLTYNELGFDVNSPVYKMRKLQEKIIG